MGGDSDKPELSSPSADGGAAAEGNAGVPGPSELRDKIKANRRGEGQQGKKRGPYSKGAGAGTGTKPRPSAAASRELFTPDNTRRLVRVPFDLAAAYTGAAGFCLDEREEAELVATGVPCLNEWVAVEPKYVALSLFSLSLLGVAASKCMGYFAALKLAELRGVPPPSGGREVPSAPRAVTAPAADGGAPVAVAVAPVAKDVALPPATEPPAVRLSTAPPAPTDLPPMARPPDVPLTGKPVTVDPNSPAAALFPAAPLPPAPRTV